MDAAEASLSKEVFAAFRRLYEFALQSADQVKLGTGATRGSFGPVYSDVCPRSVFTLTSNGEFTWNFKWIDAPQEALTFRAHLFEAVKNDFELGDHDVEAYPTYSAKTWVPRVEGIVEGVESALMAFRTRS
jgi:hypothetical protein